MIAYGLMKEQYPELSDTELWNKIAIIDTENGSGELYVNKEVGRIKIGQYNAITLSAPFEVTKYIEALEVCEEAGMEVAIIDSTTHAWSGTGGLLEQQGNTAKRTGNSWTAWRDVTPQHNKFIEKMLQSNMHIIATMRSKTEYVQEKDQSSGKITVRKIGMNPIQKDGMEYEFTLFLEIDAEHQAFGSKDRTSIYDQKYFTITPDVGKQLMEWLNSGTNTPKEVIAVSKAIPKPEEVLKAIQDEIVKLGSEKGGKNSKEFMDLLKEYAPDNNPYKIKDIDKASELLNKVKVLPNLNKEEK